MQRENHGTIVVHEFSYSAYTLWYGSYCTYGIAPSSQSSLNLPPWSSRILHGVDTLSLEGRSRVLGKMMYRIALY